MRTDRVDLSVIIVSYNTCQMTLDCLQSLYSDLGDLAAEVIVVDNDSKDGSAEAITLTYPEVRLVRNENNAGFGAANNIGLKIARGESMMLLNTDAFLHSGAAVALLDYLREHPDVGAVGPRLLNRDGGVQQSCYRYPSPGRAWVENLGLTRIADGKDDFAHWNHACERNVDWVIGACVVVRREAYEQAGGFDEAFFMYQEETDWQKRLRNWGWKIAFTPAATVTHLGGASGASDQAKINAHFFDSLDYYTRKHHGIAGLISLRLAMIVGAAFRTVAWFLISALVPKRRTLSQAKARLQAWLFVRQATHWTSVGKPAKA